MQPPMAPGDLEAAKASAANGGSSSSNSLVSIWPTSFIMAIVPKS